MKKIVLASGNQGKLVELRELLGDLGIELVAQTGLGVGEAIDPQRPEADNPAVLGPASAARSR